MKSIDKPILLSTMHTLPYISDRIKNRSEFRDSLLIISCIRRNIFKITALAPKHHWNQLKFLEFQSYDSFSNQEVMILPLLHWWKIYRNISFISLADLKTMRKKIVSFGVQWFINHFRLETTENSILVSFAIAVALDLSISITFLQNEIKNDHRQT